MLRFGLASAIFATLVGSTALSISAYAADAIPANIAASVSDAARPDTDKAADTDRKPAETLAFAGVKAGDQIADMFPGAGYFTRLLSKAVGPSGKIYAFVPDELLKLRATAADGIKAMSADAGYSNVSLLSSPIAAFKAPASLDMVWTSRNYHDLHNKVFGGDIAAFNKVVFAALKPGGIYIVLDHAAAPGAPSDVTETLHRIDPAVVKAEVTAAGFKFVDESNVLKNPSDDHSAKVFEAGLRGKTDQFIYKFRKPN